MHGSEEQTQRTRMEMHHPTPNSKPGKSIPRFVFNIVRDINLLKAAVSANPWQCGKAKWSDACKALEDAYGYIIKPRTAKERVDLLVGKLKAEELQSKTGTEEEQSEREQLLREIICLQEQEAAPVINSIGCGSEERDDANVAHVEPTVAQRRAERLMADDERARLASGLLPSTSSNSEMAPTANKFREKRTRAGREEEMIFKKHKHDMEMEVSKLKFKEDAKAQELALQNRNLDLEFLREHRLAAQETRRAESDIRFNEEMRKRDEDNQRRDEVLLKMCGILNVIQSQLEKNSMEDMQ